MDDVIDRLARIRAMRAKMARAEQQRLEGEARLLDEEADDWSSRLHEAANHPGRTGADAVGSGLFVLHGELERRRVQAQADVGHAKAEQHSERVRELETSQKIAERLAERRAEARAAERRRKEQAELDELARLTKNFTGAEIESLVKSASSHCISRTTNILDFSKELVIDEKNLRVEMQDFIKALEEVKPQFGVDE